MLPSKQTPRRGVSPPLRDLSHGSTTSHGPLFIVPTGSVSARAGPSATLPPQRLSAMLPALTASVPLLLPRLPAGRPTLATLARSADLPRHRQRPTAPPATSTTLSATPSAA